MLRAKRPISQLDDLIGDAQRKRKPKPDSPATSKKTALLQTPSDRAIASELPETGKKRTNHDPTRGENDLLD
jgi:hypothetical protein